MAVQMEDRTLEQTLVEYFLSWRPYKLIIARLEEVHGLKRSVSWLKRQFKRLCLMRRPAQYVPNSIVANCIRKELRGCNSKVGYRGMWKILREKYFLIVKRKTVMTLLKELDPQGVEQRRSHRLQRRTYFNKGPNFAWHIDGYDKLSQYGFCIHGCVDGFSRKLLWLRVSSTNHNPGVILKYFLETVEDVGGCPRVVRMDCGTENVKVAATQFAFRADHDDSHAGVKSFAYGTSPANVRIEGFWSQLRRSMTDWWISVFKELRQQGFFNCTNDIHKKCLAIIFFPLIEEQLRDFQVFWNTHRIRKSHKDCIGGIPNDLYDMPKHYGCNNYLKTVNPVLWVEAMSTESCEAEELYSDEFHARCHELVEQQYGIDLNSAITNENCVDVYLYLISVV